MWFKSELMFKYLRHNPDSLLLVLLALWAVLSGVTATLTELSPTEAYLWNSSRDLEWGYVTHPPLISMVVELGCGFFGVSELGVRFLFTLLTPLSLYIFWRSMTFRHKDWRAALCYFGVCFSIPVLHLCSMEATTASLLLFSVAVTITAFKYFLTSEVGFNLRSALSSLWLGGAFALSAYSSYMGLVILVAIILSRPRVLIDLRFYFALALCYLLLVPHIEWVADNYHIINVPMRSGDSLKLYGVLGYIFVFILCYNPLLSVPFSKSLVSRSPFVGSPMKRLLRSLALLSFIAIVPLVGSGHIEAVWFVVVIFPMVHYVVRRGVRNRSARLYINCSSLFFGLILLALHILVIYSDRPLTSYLQLSGKSTGLQHAALTLRNEEQEPVELFITDGNTTLSSLLNFYTPLSSYSLPTIYSSLSHQKANPALDSYHGKRVAIEINRIITDTTAKDSLQNLYNYVEIPNVGTHYYIVTNNYTPTSAINVELQSFPEKIITGQSLALTLRLTNPYPYDIKVGGKDNFDLVLHLGCSELGRDAEMCDIPLVFAPITLISGTTKAVTTTVKIPTFTTGYFDAGISLQRPPASSSYNSKVYNLLIVNPKSSI